MRDGKGVTGAVLPTASQRLMRTRTFAIALHGLQLGTLYILAGGFVGKCFVQVHCIKLERVELFRRSPEVALILPIDNGKPLVDKPTTRGAFTGSSPQSNPLDAHASTTGLSVFQYPVGR
jgi:hypothetical protein